MTMTCRLRSMFVIVSQHNHAVPRFHQRHWNFVVTVHILWGFRSTSSVEPQRINCGTSLTGQWTFVLAHFSCCSNSWHIVVTRNYNDDAIWNSGDFDCHRNDFNSHFCRDSCQQCCFFNKHGSDDRIHINRSIDISTRYLLCKIPCVPSSVVSPTPSTRQYEWCVFCVLGLVICVSCYGFRVLRVRILTHCFLSCTSFTTTSIRRCLQVCNCNQQRLKFVVTVTFFWRLFSSRSDNSERTKERRCCCGFQRLILHTFRVVRTADTSLSVAASTVTQVETTATPVAEVTTSTGTTATSAEPNSSPAASTNTAAATEITSSEATTTQPGKCIANFVVHRVLL